MNRLPRLPLSLLGVVLLLAACGQRLESRTRPTGDTSRLITAEQIKRSGATDAWDAIRRSGSSLHMGESRRGQPTRLNRRGRGSVYLDDSPLLVVDGTRMVDFAYLRQIPADVILSIRIFNGIDGTRIYGTGAGGGAIVVQTFTGPGE